MHHAPERSEKEPRGRVWRGCAALALIPSGVRCGSCISKNNSKGQWRAHGRYVARESATREVDRRAGGFSAGNCLCILAVHSRMRGIDFAQGRRDINGDLPCIAEVKPVMRICRSILELAQMYACIHDVHSSASDGICDLRHPFIQPVADCKNRSYTLQLLKLPGRKFVQMR